MVEIFMELQMTDRKENVLKIISKAIFHKSREVIGTGPGNGFGN